MGLQKVYADAVRCARNNQQFIGDRNEYCVTLAQLESMIKQSTREMREMIMDKWPAHKASLTLTHNDHKDAYRTVAESIDQGDHGYDDCWVSDEQKLKAIATNDCWTLHWYPETPVGFCLMSAADLDVLLEAAKRLGG